jgi:uncharacterized protein YdeI (YjbR/CyaY-like superfamily)
MSTRSEPASPADDEIEITSIAELHGWLAEHHDRQHGVWLVTWKRRVADKAVDHEAVLDELIAFGWTDGAKRRIDDDRAAQRISPRRTDVWARTYQQRARRLIDEGRMQPAGLATIERALAKGTWNEHADVDDLIVPDDLASALRAQPPAAKHFADYAPSHRRNILRWLAKAKQPETRNKRIAITVDHASKGIKVPQL